MELKIDVIQHESNSKTALYCVARITRKDTKSTVLVGVFDKGVMRVDDKRFHEFQAWTSNQAALYDLTLILIPRNKISKSTFDKLSTVYSALIKSWTLLIVSHSLLPSEPSLPKAISSSSTANPFPFEAC